MRKCKICKHIAKMYIKNANQDQMHTQPARPHGNSVNVNFAKKVTLNSGRRGHAFFLDNYERTFHNRGKSSA